MMIEPTESETKNELDKFCDSLIQIKKEVEKVKAGELPQDNNPLVNAPHTMEDITEGWNRPYSIQEGIYPLSWVKERKVMPTVNRIDNAFGDRNLVCSCLPIEAYEN